RVYEDLSEAWCAMRTAIVADIHGNLRAFEAVLQDLKATAPDRILHGGDVCFGGQHPAEIIDQIGSLGWDGVRGNTDAMLWLPEALAEFAAQNPKIAPLLAPIQEQIPPTVARLDEEQLAWLKTLPQRFSGDGFALVHARPDDLWRAPRPDA